MKLNDLRLGLLLALSAVFFQACKKVEVTKPLGDRGQTIVKFMTSPGSGGLNYNLANFQVTNTAQTVGVIDIRRDVPNEAELNKTMTVVVKEDPAVISAYNNANGTALFALPSNAYTVDASNPRSNGEYAVTFAPGEFSKQLKINLTNAQGMDLSKQYALGLTLSVAVAGADGRVSFENRSTVVELGPLNKWDGVYAMSGYVLRAGDPVLTGTFGPVEYKLLTIGSNSVAFNDLQVWGDGVSGVGIGIPELTIDPVTNLVTVSSSGGARNVTAAANYYDPATKTFHLDYTWGAGVAARRATVTLTYLRPR